MGKLKPTLRNICYWALENSGFNYHAAMIDIALKKDGFSEFEYIVSYDSRHIITEKVLDTDIRCGIEPVVQSATKMLARNNKDYVVRTYYLTNVEVVNAGNRRRLKSYSKTKLNNTFMCFREEFSTNEVEFKYAPGVTKITPALLFGMWKNQYANKPGIENIIKRIEEAFHLSRRTKGIEKCGFFDCRVPLSQNEMLEVHYGISENNENLVYKFPSLKYPYVQKDYASIVFVVRRLYVRDEERIAFSYNDNEDKRTYYVSYNDNCYFESYQPSICETMELKEAYISKYAGKAKRITRYRSGFSTSNKNNFVEFL